MSQNREYPYSKIPLVRSCISLFALLSVVFSLSCASPPLVQPQINSLVIAEKFDYALKILDENQASYGENNKLLFMLDYGMTLHIAGRYKESIIAFEDAKAIYDGLYTLSLRNQAKTWLINDYFSPYRGEDFERIMINVFQALNFVALGDIEEALVDARDVDLKLTLLNRQYNPNQKNKYKEDAFARFLMGILYEGAGSTENLNDAYISYVKAVEVYENNFYPDYGTGIPLILKENILAAAKFMGKEEFSQYRKKFKNIDFLTLQEKRKKGEIYLFYYYGFSPIKHQIAIPIPLPNGFLAKLAFPHYSKRKTKIEPGWLKAVDATGTKFTFETEEAQNITAIAIQSLEDRKVRVIAKGVLRSGGKYIAARNIEKKINNDLAADTFKYISNLYQISSEQADLRSWQTLPAQIRVARLILKPGEYKLFLNERGLGKVNISAGEKKYFIIRTTR